MKSLILFCALLSLNTFASENNAEYSLTVLNHSSICTATIQKKFDLGRIRINARIFQNKVEGIKECAAKHAIRQIYSKCQNINHLDIVEFASSPNIQDEGCQLTAVKVKGQNLVTVTCKASIEAECLKTIIE